MKGGLVVNLWSEFIKQKAEENNASYETIVNVFWKNKKLQQQWKDYKNSIIKDIFVPPTPSIPISTIRPTAPTTYPMAPKSQPDTFRARNVVEEMAQQIEEEPNVFLDIQEQILKAEPRPDYISIPKPRPKSRQKPKREREPAEEEPATKKKGLPTMPEMPLEKKRPLEEEPEQTPTKKRGRPLGSKNKPKIPVAPPLPAPSPEDEERLKMKTEDIPAPAEDPSERLFRKYFTQSTRNVPEKEVREAGIPIEISGSTGTPFVYLRDPKSKGNVFFWVIKEKATLPFPEQTKAPKPKTPVKGKGFEDWLPFIRKNYPPVIRKFLEQRGGEIIESLTIARTPLETATNLLLQTVTAITMRGDFAKRQKEKQYDKLYHLELMITTTAGTHFSIEKNEVINIKLDPQTKPNTETMPVSNIPPDLTIMQMLNNAEKRMGKKFFVYNAVTNNCQDFIMALLEGSGIGTPEEKAFIKQDIPYLFKGAKKTIGFASLLTSIAAMRNRLIEGAGMYKVQSVLFDKTKWESPDKAGEWLSSHSYLNKGVDDKENTYRFRQINPQYIKKQGYKRFVTQPLGDSGVSLILAYKK